jgi:hypothetical protein
MDAFQTTVRETVTETVREDQREVIPWIEAPDYMAFAFFVTCSSLIPGGFQDQPNHFVW